MQKENLADTPLEFPQSSKAILIIAPNAACAVEGSDADCSNGNVTCMGQTASACAYKAAGHC